MQFTFSNRDDIRRYFRGTFVKFQEFGDVLFYINDVMGDAVHGVDENGDDFVLHLHDSRPYQVDFILPHKAVYQHGRDVAIIQRNPARQYRRGICEDNITIRRLISGNLMEVSFDNLKVFVNKPNYRSLREAIYGKNSLYSVAVTPRFAFDKRSSVLWLMNKQIAIYNRETKTFEGSPLFKEDIQELIAQDPWEAIVK